MSENWYTDNPLIHRDRQLKHHDSEWVRRFSCCDLKPLIICRGPIRKEAMDVFDEMGIHGYGILLSEKDSITYSYALAPELRKLTAPDRVHRVPDYSGASKEERVARIQQIIAIARDNGYDSIFAGYGFMAEDEEMVKSMEKAGLNFIGPCSHTQRSAGLKDEAKRTALEVGVSVTPGVDNATALTLLRKSPDRQALQSLVVERGLEVDDAVWADASITLEQLSVTVLAASYAAGIDLYSVEELSSELEQLVAQMFEQYPDNRIRLKAIAGGGGKGQRILPAATSYADDDLTQQIAQAAARVPELVREILAEVKTNGVGDNKNILAEMNIETTRHQEIQVVGNGDWCITMGGRDCSLQMHEQKLLEVSVTQEELGEAITAAEQAGKPEEAASLQRDLGILEKMELEAADFGAAVGLDSVATFECIVDGSDHFFMEMNTRIQVEHRVTELCYALKFVNPDDPGDSFVANSLVEVMVLLACHGKRLPCPQRVLRETTALEARLNATNAALQPHAGGIIKHWSTTVESEIRDDQGISLRNPDTGVFMDYHLAGAYDSNIALLLTVGVDRLNTYQRMSQLLRMTKMGGINLATNLEFHYGLVQWFIGAGINARPTTAFIVPYLTLVGLLKQTTDQLDPAFSYVRIRKAYLDGAADAAAAAKLAEVIDIKETLITRAIADVFERPHLLAGWLSTRREQFTVREGKVEWLENPLVVLAETYHFLNMDYIDGAPALYQIWKNDDELMQEALAFYGDLEARTGVTDWPEMRALLEEGASAPDDLADVWPEVLAAHTGFQAGMEVLSLLPYVADKVDYFALTVNPDLTITIPERLQDKALQSDMAKVLAPPPVAKSDEIVAISGGMFYPREAPGMDIYVEEGSHFEEGDPLYIVEVMKMFNKVYAPFAGTIKKALVDGDGVIIKKGQPLFIVAPDIEIESRVPEDDIACMREATREFLATQD